MIDKSLYFGNQNFFFLDSNTSDETYDYVIFQNHRGVFLIAQYNKTGTSARYCIKTGIYSSVWSGRNGYDYVLPNEMIDPEI